MTDPSRPQGDEHPAPPTTYVYPAAGHPLDHGISIADLLRALARNWWLIAGITALALVASAVYALSQPATYQYQTSLRIGYTSAQSQRQPIANAAQVRAELESRFVPAALREVLDLSAEKLATGGRVDPQSACGVAQQFRGGPFAHRGPRSARRAVPQYPGDHRISNASRSMKPPNEKAHCCEYSDRLERPAGLVARQPLRARETASMFF
jgi:hypothetical protein